MHYIRFLKSPKLVKQNGKLLLTAKITIATDLGESFLLAPISLTADLLDSRGCPLQLFRDTPTFVWTGNGMRSLEVWALVPPLISAQTVQMILRKVDQPSSLFTPNYAILKPHSALPLAPFEGSVVALRSAPIDLATGETQYKGVVERAFKTLDSPEVHIWEETGESIARHIWDAGVMLSSFIANISVSSSTAPHITALSGLQRTLLRGDLNILELGAGCGIVGITLAMNAIPQSRPRKLVLTDLPEATEILSRNISMAWSALSPPSPALGHEVLDWSQPLPSSISKEQWELILIADCTYNPDVVPDLVATLNRIREKSPKVEVVVAMKVRHESESVFFDLMEAAKWVVKEKCTFPLPVLEGEDEEIDIYVFKGMDQK